MGTLRIISQSGKPFLNRQQAGQLLGNELINLKGEDVVVLGIPCGGVIVAYEIAAILQGKLDVILSRKLRTPGHEELAMGSITENGKTFLNKMLIQRLVAVKYDVEHEKNKQMAEITRQASVFRSAQPKINLRNRTVVVTDDGIATGLTLQAALWAVRQEHAKKIIAAVPVASSESLQRLTLDADEILCLRVPPFFNAVGQFYTEFDPVTDDEVLALLYKANHKITPE